MGSKLMTALVLACCATLGACNMVRGAAADVNSVANCTENAIKGGYCK